ncbi:MAG: ammonium transporter, partial [Candidatus Dormibacteria bacterium]
MIGALIPYQPYLQSGDNAWQLTAGTLVGLMSLPGIAVLYGGLVPRKWAVNTMLMAFTGFAAVLIVWVLWGFDMGFGSPLHITGSGFLANVIGIPGNVLSSISEQGRAHIPLLSGTGVQPQFNFPQSSLIYFQFVFAAITPLLFLGSVLGRINFKVWAIFVPAWTTCAYTVNAFLVWGGGWWAQRGAVDFSGGFVIHLAAGTSGFVAAWVIGPRLARDRQRFVPHNLMMVAIGAGILWLGWNGFNGGDPYYAGADAASAVLNTNLCAAGACLTWILMDTFVGKERKPTFLGAVNGLIVGLVVITPGAGFVNGVGALTESFIGCVVVWFSFNKLSRTRFFQKVDDAMGVVHTHGIAGLMGGLLVGVFADPNIIEYPGSGGTAGSLVTGALYGHPKLLIAQAGAALTVIVWDAFVTFALLKLIGLF